MQAYSHRPNQQPRIGRVLPHYPFAGPDELTKLFYVQLLHHRGHHAHGMIRCHQIIRTLHPHLHLMALRLA